ISRYSTAIRGSSAKRLKSKLRKQVPSLSLGRLQRPNKCAWTTYRKHAIKDGLPFRSSIPHAERAHLVGETHNLAKPTIVQRIHATVLAFFLIHAFAYGQTQPSGKQKPLDLEASDEAARRLLEEISARPGTPDSDFERRMREASYASYRHLLLQA